MIKQLFMHLKVDLPRHDIQVEIDFLESTRIGQILPIQTGNLAKTGPVILVRQKLVRLLEGVNSDHQAEKRPNKCCKNLISEIVKVVEIVLQTQILIE